MYPVFSFLASGNGRLLRIVAGLFLIGLGLFGLSAPGGIVVAVIGAVPFFAGLFDVCVFSPLFGHAFSGKAIRAGK